MEKNTLSNQLFKSVFHLAIFKKSAEYNSEYLLKKRKKRKVRQKICCSHPWFTFVKKNAASAIWILCSALLFFDKALTTSLTTFV